MDRITLTALLYYDAFDNGKRIMHKPALELKNVNGVIEQN